MAKKVKFDQEAAFKSIVGAPPAGRTSEAEKSTSRVQRSYFIDRDLDKALRRMALEEGRNLTQTVNEVLRKGLADYL